VGVDHVRQYYAYGECFYQITHSNANDQGAYRNPNIVDGTMYEVTSPLPAGPSATPSSTPTPTQTPTNTPTSTSIPFDKDTVGVFRLSNGLIYLKNSNSTGIADVALNYGIAGDYPITGDWNGDGKDTTGVFRPSNGAIFLKNTNATGIADIAINYGIAGYKPVIGDWDNNGIDTIGVLRGNVF